MDIQRIGIVGAGAWGTALAMAARRTGCETVLWARRPALAAEIAATHENAAYLPGIALDPAIRASADPAALGDRDAILLVAPAQRLGEVTRRLAPHLPAAAPLVICAKGIEQETGRLMSEVVAAAAPGRPLAVLSGPTFAAEVARGLPTAATLATADETQGTALVAALGSRAFRPYLSHDLVGAQVGGAVKNVIAIACGIAAGRALGENARAALITRGLAEIARLGRALGARAQTPMGLSGLGDLTLTCTSMLSRNYSLGRALGQGERLEAIQAGRRSVAEGVFSAGAVASLAAAKDIDMPIVEAVDGILNHGAALDDAMGGLLARPFKIETA